jgi:hypothetical protein
MERTEETPMLTLALALALTQDVDALIQKLASEDYAEREKATEQLRAQGKGAEDGLRKALGHEDPEVRARAKALLEELDAKGRPQARRPAPRVPPPGPFGQGFKGSSVSVQTVNGDSTYVITPGDGSPALTFRKEAAGPVKLDYVDDAGKAQTAGAATLEAFLKEHKDLAARYGISETGIDYAGAKVGFGPMRNPFGGGFRFNFGRPGPFPFEEPLDKPERTSDFEPASDALRAQLGLPEGQGVVVARDGAAPGLKKHDVLLEIDGRPVGSAADAKKKAAGAASFLIMRKGTRETVGTAPRKDF